MIISSIFINHYISFMNEILVVFYTIKTGAESVKGLVISVAYSILRESVNIISNITNIANKLDIFYILIFIFIIFILFIFMMNTSDNEMVDSDKNEVDFNKFINYPDSSDDDDENSKKRKHIGNKKKGNENSKKRKYITIKKKGDENSKKESFDIIKFGSKTYKSNGNKALLNIYKNSKSTYFEKYEPIKNILNNGNIEYNRKNETKELTTFKEIIYNIIKDKKHMDVNKYKTMYHVKDTRKYVALINGFKGVQAKNRHLELS
jgi:hypothetical protein